jgi:hypothetical protein
VSFVTSRSLLMQGRSAATGMHLSSTRRGRPVNKLRTFPVHPMVARQIPMEAGTFEFILRNRSQAKFPIAERFKRPRLEAGPVTGYHLWRVSHFRGHLCDERVTVLCSASRPPGEADRNLGDAVEDFEDTIASDAMKLALGAGSRRQFQCADNQGCILDR